MRYVQVTDRYVKDALCSMVIPNEIADMVNGTVLGMCGGYVPFLKTVISTGSNNYIDLNSPECPLGFKDRAIINDMLLVEKLGYSISDVVVADRMDLMYAIDSCYYETMGKFKPFFYKHMEDTLEKVYGLAWDNEGSSVLEEVINALERFVSLLEQRIISSADLYQNEDTVILGLGSQLDNLIIVVC